MHRLVWIFSIPSNSVYDYPLLGLINPEMVFIQDGSSKEIHLQIILLFQLARKTSFLVK